MKYIINYNNQGKILGFTKGDTGLNLEVSNAIWFEAQSYNKIIINGENTSFDKVDWRTDEEIAKEELQSKINESKQYLNKTDHKFYSGYKPKKDEDLIEIERLRDEAREFIRTNDVDFSDES